MLRCGYFFERIAVYERMKLLTVLVTGLWGFNLVWLWGAFSQWLTIVWMCRPWVTLCCCLFSFKEQSGHRQWVGSEAIRTSAAYIHVRWDCLEYCKHRTITLPNTLAKPPQSTCSELSTNQTQLPHTNTTRTDSSASMVFAKRQLLTVAMHLANAASLLWSGACPKQSGTEMRTELLFCCFRI